MLYNHAYEAVKQKHREEFQRDKNFLKLNTANYIKIVNLGTGLIFNCVARTKNKLDASEEESWDVNAEIGILSKDEEVFFCTDNAEYWGQAYNTVSVIVDYESSVGEKLRYVRKIEGKDDDMIVIENFYKKSWFFYRRFST